MVVGYLHFVGSISLPDEADSVLVIDANAVLPGPISSKSLQPIPGWRSEIAKPNAEVELIELSQSHGSNRRPTAIGFLLEELESVGVLEAPDHCLKSITSRVTRKELHG